MASLRFPKIGTIVRAEDDGSYTIGPFPDIGGPFNTATEIFESQPSHAKFPCFLTKYGKNARGSPRKRFSCRFLEFPSAVREKAHQLFSSDRRPFPLVLYVHADFFFS